MTFLHYLLIVGVLSNCYTARAIESQSESQSLSLSSTPAVFYDSGSIAHGLGEGATPCEVDQRSFWYDDFSLPGGSMVCGGTMTNNSIPSVVYPETSFCGQMSDSCLPHTILTNHTRHVHVIKDNSVFCTPTTFGETDLHVTILFTSSSPDSLVPFLELYDDYEGTTLENQMMYDSMMVTPYSPICGESNATVYEYKWNSINTTNFAANKSLAMSWNIGPSEEYPIRVFLYEIMVMKPVPTTFSLLPQKCDVRLSTPLPAEQVPGPGARRSDKEVETSRTARAGRKDLARAAYVEICSSMEGGYLLIMIDSSGSIGSTLMDYLDAVEEFINELEGSNVGIAILDFDGPSTIFGGSTANSARWVTPAGGPGTYRHMDNPSDVTLIRNELMSGGITSGGSTNWEAAFDLANTLTPIPNITIFLTDGNPTISNGYCYSANVNNADWYASQAATEAGILKTAGSRIKPILFGTDVSVEYSTALIMSDGAAANTFCFGGSDPPTNFVPSTSFIASNVSLENPLVDGTDYFTAINTTVLVDLIRNRIVHEICTNVSLSESHSWSQSQSVEGTESLSHSQSQSSSYSRSGSESNSQSPSESQSQSMSYSRSGSESNSQSPSESQSQSTSYSRSGSESNSQSPSESQSQSASYSRSGSESNSQSPSESQSQSASYSRSGSESNSQSPSESQSQSASYSRSGSESNSQSPSESQSQSSSHSRSMSRSRSPSESESQSSSQSRSMSSSQSPSDSQSLSTSRSQSLSESESRSSSRSHSDSSSRSRSASRSQSRSYSRSESESRSHSESLSNSYSQSPSMSQSQSSSQSRSVSNSESESRSGSRSRSPSQVESLSHSNSGSVSDSQSMSQSPSESQSSSRSLSESESMSRSNSHSHSNSRSHSLSNSNSYSSSRSSSLSQSLTHSESQSNSRSLSNSESNSPSQSDSRSQSRSQSQSPSDSNSRSRSSSLSQSRTQSESQSNSRSTSNSASNSPSQSDSRTRSRSQSQSHSESASRSQTHSLSQSQSFSVSHSQSQSQSMALQGCTLAFLCLFSNISPPEGLSPCTEQSSIYVLQNHVNFTWVNQTNPPDSPVTITLRINSEGQGCPVEWSGVAEGVPSATPNPVTNNFQSNFLVHENVNFGGDWLNYRIWVNDTSCSPFIEDVTIVYSDPEAPCECYPDPQFKPDIIGICTPEPCDHPDAVTFFGDTYACMCGNATFDRCGVCDGDGTSCQRTCCDRVTPSTPLMAPYPYWDTYKRCENEEDEMPMEGMCYSLRSILADPTFDFPPPFGLRVGELTCDFSHHTSQIILCVENGGLHFNGTVWCGFDSSHDNNYADTYENYQPPHPYHFSMWFTNGVDFSMPGMISVSEPNKTQDGDVSSDHCGYLISTIDEKDVTKICAKTNEAGQQLKITNGTNDYWEPGITGQGWFMNMNCTMPCDYCGHHFQEDNINPDDMQRCNPGDWMWVLEAKCNLNSESQSQSLSDSHSMTQSLSQSMSSSESQSNSQSRSGSQSESQSLSQSLSASHSVSPYQCCWINESFPVPPIQPCDQAFITPADMNQRCYKCMCTNTSSPFFNDTSCCGFAPYISEGCESYNDIIAANCETECCGPTTEMECTPQSEPNECNVFDCCCDPFQYPMMMPPIMFPLPEDERYCGPVIELCSDCIVDLNPNCQEWLDNKGNITDQSLIDQCQLLHSDPQFCGFPCCRLGSQPPQECPQSHSVSQSWSQSISVSFSSSESFQPCCYNGFGPIPEGCGALIPYPDFPECNECLCNGTTDSSQALRDNGCCTIDGNLIANCTLLMTNDGSEIIRTAGCLDDCCIQAKRDPCDPFTEFFYGTCCCNPLSQGCPAELTNECFECVQTNALIHDPTANCTGWEGQENFPWEDCMYAHRYECVQECCVEPESESLSQSTSMSPSQSTSESCPPLEIPDPPCENRNLYDELYHPETWDCVCQSGPWRCGVCNGASNTECECPCRQVVENQRVCDLYPHIPSAQCLFYQDCHPADEPEFIDYFKMYGLRSHSGWLKNNSFIDDRKKAPPLFGIVIGELVLDFSHKNSHVKMIVNWDSIHITGHAWGGYDLNNEGDNGIWDGWEALENIEPRVGPWKIDIWYTDGFQHDFSGVTGVPGEVSEINCGTITDPKDWNNTIEICAKADEEGYQLRLENTYHGETGISGFGWFHNMLCDDRCGLFLNQYHCPDADMHFVLESECGDVQSPSESASPSPPKEPCCMRMSPVRFPNETISGPEPGKRRFHDYGYYYNQESASESQSSSVSQTPTFENELLICDPTLSPFMIMPGAEYQLRDHFSIKKNVQFPPIDGSIPGFPGHIVHGGLRFGNLYITFTEEGTLLKMFYQPGQDSVLIKGHGWGRVLDEYGNYKEGFEPGTPLGPQFYHVEMEYVTGLHHVHGIKRIPRGAGGIPFLVRERDPETEKPIPVNHSKYNRGLLYPKDYHDLVIEFGAMDVPAPMFLVPDLIPNVQAVQFAIISNDDLELGTNGGFHGLGALWANCSNLEVDGSSSVSEQEEEEATVENLLAQVCVPQIVTIMMGQSQIEVPDGSGWLNFVIEGECPCDNPSPSPGFCPEHGVYHTHGDPAENSLSHSQSPLQSNTPHPDVNTTYPGQGFSRLKASTHIAVQMGETSLPPEKWNDPTIEYRKRQASGEDFFNPPTWQADTGYVVFTSDAFTTPYRFVTYNVAPAPEYELNGLRPGREWIFVQIQWNATNLPANFITKIGAGGVGDESPEKEQCGEGGGHNYTQCWIKFPPYGGVLYIGAATQPFYHLELDMELIGVNLTMVAENKIDFVRHVGMGIYAPYSPEDEFAQNSSEYNLGVFMLAGLGFAGMAAGVMFFRPKSASARMAASVRKGKGKATIQQV